MGDVLQQRRQNRKNQPDADGIENNGGEDDDKGDLVMGAFRVDASAQAPTECADGSR
ncbi:hypothetical protein [Rhizobium phaseoli]|uniref:hypothetical protein n=1 Tax=Rhizobium phaseoli TaxID=396 RepID=UPI001CEDF061|nr:hypothetical protein [Rhizobium phaseoli]MDK4730435.1 hypothetical protein [Rhizobium phaseoli]